VIPLGEYPNDPYDRKAVMNGLHQAYLRSPRRIPREDQNQAPGRYFQSIKGLVAGPVRVIPGNKVWTLDFAVSEQEMALLTGPGLPAHPHPHAWQYFNGCLRYRLRMCSFPDIQRVSEQDWATAATSWHEHVFVKFNSIPKLIRRRQHNGKDQAMELTTDIIQGINTLNVVVSGALQAKQSLFMAVELVETLSHSAIDELVRTQGFLAPQATRDVIATRLAPPSADDDDIIVATADAISIDLADPFSSKLWEVPVRGADCRHLECFDLNVWLSTRPKNPDCNHAFAQAKDCSICRYFVGDEPSKVDKWKCPLCSGDARPRSLRLDGYLADVREQLLSSGMGKAKSILVSADGSWVANGVDEDSDDDMGEESPPPTRDESAGVLPALRPPRRDTTAEIIIIDDD